MGRRMGANGIGRYVTRSKWVSRCAPPDFAEWFLRATGGRIVTCTGGAVTERLQRRPFRTTVGAT